MKKFYVFIKPDGSTVARQFTSKVLAQEWADTKGYTIKE